MKDIEKPKARQEDHVLRDFCLLMLVSSALGIPIALSLPKPSNAEIMRALETRVATQAEYCNDPFYKSFVQVEDYCRSRLDDAKQLEELRQKVTP